MALKCQKTNDEIIATETITEQEDINSKYYGSIWNSVADTLPRKLILFYIERYESRGDCYEGNCPITEYYINSTCVVDSLTITSGTTFYELEFNLNNPCINREVSEHKTFYLQSYPDSIYEYEFPNTGVSLTADYGNTIESFGFTGIEVNF